MYYDKRIRYLSYYESDIKLQNAGYVKFQVRDSLCQMIIYVKGPRLMGNGETAVYLLSRKGKEADEDSFYAGSKDSRLRKHLLGNLSIRGGQGHCAVRMNAENMADSGLRYDEICGIRIELHEYQYLESLWCVANPMPEKRQPQGRGSGMAGYQLRREQEDMWQERYSGREDISADKPVEIDLIVTPASENATVEKLVTEEEMNYEDSGIKENDRVRIIEAGGGPIENMSDDEDSMQGLLEKEIRKEESEASNKTIKIEFAEKAQEATEATEAMETAETAQAAETIEATEAMEIAEDAEAEAEVQSLEQELQPDKWEQLRATYPVVHPIREEEEYLKITPRDFVIFTKEYQELVHNSFLLHGYYNYKHLILGRKERDGKLVYYLGVPGTFHDREKSVAVMFGFEAFDGKREPAEKGDFGYYLRRVEI